MGRDFHAVLFDVRVNDYSWGDDIFGKNDSA